MSKPDLHCSSGPVSSMPGSSHAFPEGSVCDDHADRPAVARIQGETDSFGCEYVLMCAECRDAFWAFRDQERQVEKYCDWCRTMQKSVVPHRDMDEGSAGPLYNVCSKCIAKETEEAYAELESLESQGFDDPDPDRDFDDSDVDDFR